jgi:hypothetical protein
MWEIGCWMPSKKERCHKQAQKALSEERFASLSRNSFCAFCGSLYFSGLGLYGRDRNCVDNIARRAAPREIVGRLV